MNPDYWDQRYRSGRDSGAGSRGEAAQAKADQVNTLIRDRNVRSVVDWGCGDGEVLSRLDLDGVEYVGVDLSAEAVTMCLHRCPGHTFARVDTRINTAVSVTADLALSQDVTHHFPHEPDLTSYLDHVFGSAQRLVLLHATDHDAPRSAAHVQHRRFTPTVAARYPDWKLTDQPDDPVRPGFYLYERR